MKERAAAAMGQLPLLFVRNDGQWADEVAFGARGNGITASCTSRGLVVAGPVQDGPGSPDVRADERRSTKMHALALDFFPPDRQGTPVGERRIGGVHHYLIGSDPSAWRTDVPVYEAVRFDDVAPGVSMVALDREGRLTYDLHVEAGARLEDVSITCRGVDSIEVEPDGTLAMHSPAGTLRQSTPEAWYESVEGGREPVLCHFRVDGLLAYGFEVDDRDSSRKLVVDPGLMWSTYLGGDGADHITGVDFAGGKLTVVGCTDPTTSNQFPWSAGAYDTSQNGGSDAFVTRFDPSKIGTAQLVFSTFLGGAGHDSANGVSVTAANVVAVCGDTTSKAAGTPPTGGFPVTSNAAQGMHPWTGGGPVTPNAAFVALLNATGNALMYGSYYGGSNGETTARAVEVVSSTITTIAGWTVTNDLVLANAYDPQFDGVDDGFVARFDPTQTTGPATLTYSTYVGGDSSTTSFSPLFSDKVYALDLDGSWIYVGGSTVSGPFGASAGFHTKGLLTGSAFDLSHNGMQDGFLMALDPNATPANQLKYATFLGGTTTDEVLGIDVYQGVFFACGRTDSNNFPLSVGGTTDENVPFQGTLGSSAVEDVFVTKLDPAHPFSQLRYSTYIGGPQGDQGLSIRRFADMCAVVVGFTNGTGYPVGAVDPAGPYDASFNGMQDAFLTRLNWANNRLPIQQLDYSTFIGGSAGERAVSLVMNGADAYFGGFTSSTNYPVFMNISFDWTWNGGSAQGDAFASMIQLPPLPFP